MDQGRNLIEALRDLAPRLTIENRVQLRWETFAFGAFDLLDWAMGAPLMPSLAFNDHLSMAMRSLDTPIQNRLFEHDPAFPLADLAAPRLAELRHTKHAEHAGLNLGDYMDLIARVWGRRADVVPTIQTLAVKARDRGVPMPSHEDTQVETRRFYRDIGAP